MPNTDAGNRLAAELGVPYRIALINEAEAKAYENGVMDILRVIHDSDQWQNGGTHPNTFDLSKCGECAAVLAVINGKT